MIDKSPVIIGMVTELILLKFAILNILLIILLVLES